LDCIIEMENMASIKVLTSIRDNYGYIHRPLEDVLVVKLPQNDGYEGDPIYTLRGKMKYDELISSTGNLLPISDEDIKWMDTFFTCPYIITTDGHNSLFFNSPIHFLHDHIQKGTDTDITKLYNRYLICRDKTRQDLTFAKFKTFLPSNFTYAFKTKGKIDGIVSLIFQPNIGEKLPPRSLNVGVIYIDDVRLQNHWITINPDIYGKYIISRSSSEISASVVICGQLSDVTAYGNNLRKFSKEVFLSLLEPTTDVIPGDNDNIIFSQSAYNDLKTMLIT
jgi:hypothetical protein